MNLVFLRFVEVGWSRKEHVHFMTLKIPIDFLKKGSGIFISNQKQIKLWNKQETPMTKKTHLAKCKQAWVDFLSKRVKRSLTVHESIHN